MSQTQSFFMSVSAEMRDPSPAMAKCLETFASQFPAASIHHMSHTVTQLQRTEQLLVTLLINFTPAS